MTTSPQVNIIKQDPIITAALQEQRVLLIGQMTTGTATPLSLVENIGNSGQEDALFGANSMLADMARVFKLINKDTRLDAIPLADDGAGVAASVADIIAGTATEAGTISYTIGSLNRFTFTVEVAVGDDADVIGPKIVTAVAAATKLQVSASYSAAFDTLTFTAANKGLEGNKFTIMVDINVAGITHTLSGFFAGGTTNPSLTGVFDAIDGFRYQNFVWPTTYDISLVDTELAARFNVSNAIMDGYAKSFQFDTFANLLTLANAKNSRFIEYPVAQLVNTADYKGCAIAEFPASITAHYVAIMSKLRTQRALISDLVFANAPSGDRFGGPRLATRPRFNTPFQYLPAIPQEFKFTEQEIMELQSAGTTVFVNNDDNSLLTMRDAITTYKRDLAGNPDVSAKYVNYVETVSTIAEVFFREVKVEYAQSRMSSGQGGGSNDTVTESSFSSFMDSIYLKLTGDDYLLVRNDPKALQLFSETLSPLFDFANGSITADTLIAIITQARQFNIFQRITFDI